MKIVVFLISMMLLVLLPTSGHAMQVRTNASDTSVLAAFLSCFTGEFDNFSQVAAAGDIPYVPVAGQVRKSHRHLHTEVVQGDTAGVLLVRHYEADTQRLLGGRKVVVKQAGRDAIRMQVFDLKNMTSPVEEVFWRRDSSGFTGTQEGVPLAVWRLSGDTLLIRNTRLFAHSGSEPYRMLRCHIYTGELRWQEEGRDPNPQPDVRITVHDQGGIARVARDGQSVLYFRLATAADPYSGGLLLSLESYESEQGLSFFGSNFTQSAVTNPGSRKVGMRNSRYEILLQAR